MTTTAVQRIADTDVITSASPLEGSLLGVHPRLYVTDARFRQLTAPRQPHAVRRILDSLIAAGEAAAKRTLPPDITAPGDHRGIGSSLPCIALAWKITGDTRHRDATVAQMDVLAQWTNWGTDLEFGHITHGFAVALDWCWHDLDEAKRATYIDTLYRNALLLFEKWRSYQSGIAFGYTCNHHTVALAGLCAAACTLYGEHAHIAPWLNMALEKTRASHDALGPDGVSPESVAYGAYYSHYLIKSTLLLRDLIGVDLLRDSAWWRAYPLALIHHTLPRKHWTSTTTFMMFGDTDGHHWYGPDAVCRVLAAAFGDTRAQWLAEALDESEVHATPQERILTLGVIDPDVPVTPPDDLPPFAHFTDHDIVIGRSDWSDDGSVYGFCCGPSMGHKGVRNYRNPIAGGHMHAFAGTFQVFSHGQFVICPAGYTAKWTRYHNTLLINGEGQIGETNAWFEDLEFRRGHPTPRMLHAQGGGAYDYLVGDAGKAYPDALGVRRFVRHMLYVRPNAWVIVDDIDLQRPATLSLLFHTGFAVSAGDANTFTGSGERASLALRLLAPADAKHRTETQAMLYTTDGRHTHDLDLLTLETPAPMQRTVFVTLLVTGDAGKPANVTDATANMDDEAVTVSLPRSAGGGTYKIAFTGGIQQKH